MKIPPDQRFHCTHFSLAGEAASSGGGAGAQWPGYGYNAESENRKYRCTGSVYLYLVCIFSNEGKSINI